MRMWTPINIFLVLMIVITDYAYDRWLELWINISPVAEICRLAIKPITVDD